MGNAKTEAKRRLRGRLKGRITVFGSVPPPLRRVRDELVRLHGTDVVGPVEALPDLYTYAFHRYLFSAAGKPVARIHATLKAARASSEHSAVAQHISRQWWEQIGLMTSDDSLPAYVRDAATLAVQRGDNLLRQEQQSQ